LTHFHYLAAYRAAITVVHNSFPGRLGLLNTENDVGAILRREQPQTSSSGRQFLSPTVFLFSDCSPLIDNHHCRP
ncbi:MAG: hypothetical protein J0653_07470, partial [Deltaproteobacteria bacterium]|nr:hypothetical protein [Deltaproteobacteria bacterium]